MGLAAVVDVASEAVVVDDARDRWSSPTVKEGFADLLTHVIRSKE
jgi:hypothetical protein